MANRLKMAKMHAIQVLRSRGWSQRRIGRELGVHRDTSARHVRQDVEATGPDPPKQAISITGSDQVSSAITGAPDAALPDISIAGSSGATTAGRRSRCEPYRAAIIEMLERGLSPQRIWQDLKGEHGLADSYQSVQRFVRKLRTTSPLPFRRMECEPGDEAQVDFGTAAPVITSDGEPAAWRSHTPPIVCATSATCSNGSGRSRSSSTSFRSIRSFVLWPTTVAWYADTRIKPRAPRGVRGADTLDKLVERAAARHPFPPFTQRDAQSPCSRNPLAAHDRAPTPRFARDGPPGLRFARRH